jgi:3-keto-5-aminohexanoate cleavage enzyme
MAFEEPLILTVAPNGARKTKADHPALPILPEELAAEAEACCAAGAAMIHLHVRDAKEGHSLDAGRYGEAIAAIRERVGDRIVIQMTTEAVGIYSPAEQMAAVRAVEPEGASLAVRELFGDPALEAEASRFCHEQNERGCLAQYILYSDEDLVGFDRLVARGLIPPGRLFLLFVLGRYTPGQKSDPTDLLPYLARNSEGHRWAVCAFGAKEAACAGAALCLGGHVRVGFENNLRMADGSSAPSNAALVGQAAQAAKAVGRPLADAAAVRTLLRP